MTSSFGFDYAGIYRLGQVFDVSFECISNVVRPVPGVYSQEIVGHLVEALVVAQPEVHQLRLAVRPFIVGSVDSLLLLEVSHG